MRAGHYNLAAPTLGGPTNQEETHMPATPPGRRPTGFDAVLGTRRGWRGQSKQIERRRGVLEDALVGAGVRPEYLVLDEANRRLAESLITGRDYVPRFALISLQTWAGPSHRLDVCETIAELEAAVVANLQQPPAPSELRQPLRPVDAFDLDRPGIEYRFTLAAEPQRLDERLELESAPQVEGPPVSGAAASAGERLRLTRLIDIVRQYVGPEGFSGPGNEPRGVEMPVVEMISAADAKQPWDRQWAPTDPPVITHVPRYVSVSGTIGGPDGSAWFLADDLAEMGQWAVHAITRYDDWALHTTPAVDLDTLDAYGYSWSARAEEGRRVDGVWKAGA